MAATKVIAVADDSGWIIYCFACGCGHKFNRKQWQFNGDYVLPTFSPALRWRVPPNPLSNQHEHICHCTIRDGKIEYADDCTHAMAGMTYDLHEFKVD